MLLIFSKQSISMINIRRLEYHKSILPGDALIIKNNGLVSIFYSYGIVLNDKFFPGTLRFNKSSYGVHNITSLAHHGIFSEEVYGTYEKNISNNNLAFDLNFEGNTWQIASLEDVLAVLNGKNTFNKRASEETFYHKLATKFQEINFSEVGSSNVGLYGNDSDRDIYVMNNYDILVNYLKNNLEEFGLRINKKLFNEEIKILRSQYCFSRERAEEICSNKLAGLELDGCEINFFDARINPIIKYVFNPNDFSNIKLEGIVVNDEFKGHYVVSYDVKSDLLYSVAFIRKHFQKKKSYVLKKDDTVEIIGVQVNKTPNVIVAKDLKVE